MTVSTETVRMAKSRPGQNQSERSDLPCHIIKRVPNRFGGMRDLAFFGRDIWDLS